MNKDLALQKCMKLCSIKEYAPVEIIEKMRHWGVKEEDIVLIIAVLIKEKFLDEYRMARYYVNDKIKFNKWGRIKVGLMLRQKGISNDAINEALEQVNIDEYAQIIEIELKKKLKTVKETDPYRIRGKLVQFATGRGFETDLTHRIIDNLLK